MIVTAIACGESHTLMLTSSGYLYSFGNPDACGHEESESEDP